MSDPRIFVAPNRATPAIGKWLTLDCCWDADDIRNAISEAAGGADEPDIPTVEGIPQACYHAQTGTIDADKLAEWLALDEDEGDMVALYWDNIDHSADVEDIKDAFQGYHDSGAAFAEQIAEDCGEIPKGMPSWIVIDWEASWECNLRHDYSSVQHEGSVYIWCNI